MWVVVCGAPTSVVGDHFGDQSPISRQKNKKFANDFRVRRGGRVAEGGGLLNRYTV